MINKAILIGRLGQDPEKRITPQGKAVVNVSLATQQKKDGPTQWHRLVFWEKLAEIVEKYCKKGTQIYVEGEIQYRDWTDNNNNKRTSTDIVCFQMKMLDTKESKPADPPGPSNDINKSYDDAIASGEMKEDDIPF